MTLRALCLTTALTVSLLIVPLEGEAEQPKKVSRVGYLASSGGEPLKSRLGAFRQGLRELGYVEGKNIVVEHRTAEGIFARLPELAAELVRSEVNVLVTEGTPAAHAAKNASSVIPIVIGNAGDPVGSGLVVSLARPGGNVTGLSDFASGVAVKRLQLLKETVPSASRVAVLSNPRNSTNPLQLKELEAAALPLGVTLLALNATKVEDIDRAFAMIGTHRPSALITLGDALFGMHGVRIAELAAKSQIPAIGPVGPFVDAGGLMSYAVDFDDLHRRAATYVDKILRGANPGELPIEQPTKLILVVNLKAAGKLGLTVPQSILHRADRVIQ